MSKTFDQGREEIARLCRYFADNRQDFFAPGVKEAHVRLVYELYDLKEEEIKTVEEGEVC
jgi:hypothetical protein